MPTAQHLKLRCFLEGIEVPIISANLTIQPDTPAQCQVQIPATDKGHQFLPRTLIHVFYYDYHDGPGDTLSIDVAAVEQVVTAAEEAEVREQQAAEGRVEQPEAAPGTPTTDGSVAGRETNIPAGEDIPDSPPAPETPSGELPSDAAPAPAGPIHSQGPRGEGEDVDPPPEEVDIEDNKWKIYFAGEVTGYQFVKSHSNRGLILQCMDLSLYWDTCYQYKVNVASLTGNGLAHFVGAGTTLFDVFFQSSTSSIIDVVNRRSFSRPDLTGLMSGVVHLLERVGGVYTSRGFRGVNDFFSIAELRLHLVDMITASEHDTSSQRVFARRAFNRWTRRQGGQLGKIASFREILNLLNKFIFHNTIPNPIAMYEPPASYTRTRTRRVRYNLSSTSRGQEILSRMRTARGIVARTRSAYQGLAAVEGDLTQIQNALTSLAAVCRNSSQNLQSIGASSASTTMLSARQKAQEALSHIRRGAPHGADLVDQIFGDMLADIDDAISDFTGQENSSTRSRTRTVNNNARVNSQIIRPDIFMVSPPRCNVLFPELYSQMQFSRQFLREVTRMRLTVSDEIFGPDALLDNWYYAPDVEVLGERVRQGRGGHIEGATLRRASMSRRLMDHELYTGVVPVFERMNEVNIAAARSNMVTRRGAVVPYAARAANFQFFKHRMAPRSMSVTGKFNPYIAPGFPALVMDRYMTKEGIELSNLRGLDLQGEALSRGWATVVEERDQNPAGSTTGGEFDPNTAGAGTGYTPADTWLALRETVPTQFVGLVMNVTHTISQSSASTNYTLSTTRTHRERDELLSANMINVSRRFAGQATRTTVVAALEGMPPRVGSLGPYYGLITAVEEVNRSGSFNLFGTFQGDRPRRQRVSVPVGITQTAQAFGPEVIAMVGSRSEEVTFRAYQITEEVDRWRGQEVEIPMEDFLRPPWMSDVWSSDRIGAVYQQFFGVGAITDPITINTGLNQFTPTADRGQTDAETDARNEAIQDPIQADGTTEQRAETDLSVEKATDLLVRAYSVIRHEGLDAHEFIRAYTWRPVATLVEMLGSRDLEIDPATGTVTAGVEGFHSRAFGRGAMGRNLRNLVPENRAGESADAQAEGQYSHASRLLGISTQTGADRRNLLTRLDKRSSKSVRVLEYVDELYASRGQLG